MRSIIFTVSLLLWASTSAADPILSTIPDFSHGSSGWFVGTLVTETTANSYAVAQTFTTARSYDDVLISVLLSPIVGDAVMTFTLAEDLNANPGSVVATTDVTI